MSTWTQIYDPLNNIWLSALIADTSNFLLHHLFNGTENEKLYRWAFIV